MTTKNAIEINDLTVVYTKGLFREAGRGVNNLSFTVEQGSLFGFLGPNGAGKTTTIKVMTSLLAPTSGSALILGNNAKQKSARRLIGYMPENPYFYEHLTALESLEFYGALFDIPKEESRRRGAELLVQVELLNVEDVRVGEFSKGMRQRLGFAQALINEPQVVILDEPLSGLDPLGRSVLTRCMRSLTAEGKTVLISSHILPDVENTCTHIALIKQGKLLEIGPIEKIMASSSTAVDVLISSEKPVQELFGEGVSVEQRSGNLFAVRVSDQAESDAVIWKAVEAGLSITGVQPVRQDLEQFFVNRVSQKEDVT